MVSNFLEKLVDKTLTKEELYVLIEHNFRLLPKVVNGMNSSKAAIRYGCGKVLMELSGKHPDKLYYFMDFFITILDSKFRILTWQAMAIIANLTIVDNDKKFDLIFDKYFSFINDEYMVTVANLVGNSGKIALSKPYLIPKITHELLKVDNLKITPHLTEECKRVIAESAITSFDMFFDKMENKDKVLSFVKNYSNSSRKKLKKKADDF